MDGPLLKNIDGPSEIVKTHCVGPGKLSCNDQLPLFCTIFFLNTQYDKSNSGVPCQNGIWVKF